MNDDFKEAVSQFLAEQLDEARSRATFARYRKASTPNATSAARRLEGGSAGNPSDVEDWPEFCAVEFNEDGWRVWPRRYEGDN